MANEEVQRLPITSGGKFRKRRGRELARTVRIDRKDGKYLVPSTTNPLPTRYVVSLEGEYPSCTCDDHLMYLVQCKHIYAAKQLAKEEREGKTSQAIVRRKKSKSVAKKLRPTYKQDWSAYNKAQMQEKRLFQELLADLCEHVADPSAEKQKRGRPRVPLGKAIFTNVLKVYSGVSGRRFTTDSNVAAMNGHIDTAIHYNTAFKYMESPNVTPVLMSLIERSAAPLNVVEYQFAVDATGFAFCRFDRWYEEKYGAIKSKKQWLKAHLACGTMTNIVTAAKVTESNRNDGPELPGLVQRTADNFVLEEVSADKGYAGVVNHNAIEDLGAKSYIMFKTGATGAVGGAYGKMFHYFSLNKEEFLRHYHRRSNVESTVMMIKTKFGDSVRSKSKEAATNEILCKILAHNICCLISAMFELELTIDLGKREWARTA